MCPWYSYIWPIISGQCQNQQLYDECGVHTCMWPPGASYCVLLYQCGIVFQRIWQTTLSRRITIWRLWTNCSLTYENNLWKKDHLLFEYMLNVNLWCYILFCGVVTTSDCSLFWPHNSKLVVEVARDLVLVGTVNKVSNDHIWCMEGWPTVEYYCNRVTFYLHCFRIVRYVTTCVSFQSKVIEKIAAYLFI